MVHSLKPLWLRISNVLKSIQNRKTTPGYKTSTHLQKVASYINNYQACNVQMERLLGELLKIWKANGPYLRIVSQAFTSSNFKALA